MMRIGAKERMRSGNIVIVVVVVEPPPVQSISNKKPDCCPARASYDALHCPDDLILSSIVYKCP